MFTKAESDAIIRGLIDDPDSKRWSDTELENFVTAVLDSMWRRILLSRPHFLATSETVATPAGGIVSLSSDLSNRVHHILAVLRDDVEYHQADWRSITLEGGEAIVYPSKSWAVLGDSLYLFPLSTDAAEVRYSYIPPKYNSLADDATVVWPDGHELAYILQAAGLMLLKGAAEDASQMLGSAEMARRAMMESLPKTSIGGTQMWTNDTPEGWGGNL